MRSFNKKENVQLTKKLFLSVSDVNSGLFPITPTMESFSGYHSNYENVERNLKKYPCPHCPSAFSRKNGLICHLRFECGQPPRFKCPYCDYLSKKSSNIQKHVRIKHPGEQVSYIFI